jgi:hypothetical protein
MEGQQLGFSHIRQRLVSIKSRDKIKRTAGASTAPNFPSSKRALPLLGVNNRSWRFT